MNFLFRHAYDVGHVLGTCLWPFFVARRRISVANILRGGVTDDPKAARRLARRAFAHFVGHIAEAVCVPFVVTRDNWRDHLEIGDETDPAAAKLLLDSPGRPVLLVSSHHGVWEAATNVLSFARPMYAVARVPNNGFVARVMERFHFRGPVTIIDKNRGFTPAVLEGWQREGAGMAILMDQYTRGGARLTFFGRPARTFTSPTRLAMRTGAPIVIGSFVRVAPYRYRPVAGAPIVLAKDTDRDAATQLLNDRLEAVIRRYPDQYLWMHKRWRDD